MPRGDLRDRLDGNELDLSMDSLSVVPIKELAGLPRATHVDLSCNSLQSLPVSISRSLTTVTDVPLKFLCCPQDQFCSMLTHLVKLDLSKNQLTALPEEFGSLQRLQYLDLFENKIESLPVSMYKMKNLRYLDLKSNPLNDTLLKVAGDCVDDAQCKNCAKRVLSFMRDVNAEQERRRQKELQRQRDLEAEKRAEEELVMAKERERIKVAKLALKEKRRVEYEAKQAEIRRQEKVNTSKPEKSAAKTNGVEIKTKTKSSRKGMSCMTVLVSLAVLSLAVLIGLLYFCQQHSHIPQCRQTLSYYNSARVQTIHYYTALISEMSRYLQIARREFDVAVEIVRQKLS